MTEPEVIASQVERFTLASLVTGTLHIHVAFDWGDEVDLARAQRLVPSQYHVLSRRRRTPSSIAYRPPPLSFRLAPASLLLPEVGAVAADASATVFDFAAVSVTMRVPLNLSAARLLSLASSLADPDPLVKAAREALTPLFRELAPAILRPDWSDLSEEYFVFELAPGPPLAAPARLLEEQSAWLAGLVRLERESLSSEEMAEALRVRLSYSPRDILVLEWSAAVLIDRDCEETLEVIEYANLQLLEFRHTDNRLDEQLTSAWRLIHPLARTWLPFWRTHARSLRMMGDLRIEANAVFERTNNALKLVGDQYLARIYRMLAARFHLERWSESIDHSLDVAEGVYRLLADQTGSYRLELLEIIIILLIALEIVLALIGHY